MVEPTETDRTGPGARGLLLAALALAGLPGCGLVPKSKLDECHKVTQTLRAENGRLKDQTLSLRGQNQDLSQRAVDDARRIAAKDEANAKLIESVRAYQAERDRLAEAYDALERQVRVAGAGGVGAGSSETSDAGAKADPPTRGEALRAFAAAHPGWSFDEESSTLSAPASGLFEKGDARLTAEARSALDDLADGLATPGAELALEVVAPAEGSPVVAAGFRPESESKSEGALASASARFLGAARAARVRDALVAGAGLDPARVRLRPAPSSGDGDRTRIAIRVVGRGG